MAPALQIYAGPVAKVRLAEQGQRVLVVAKGVGATHLAPPAIDVLGYLGEERVSSPAASLPALVASQSEPFLGDQVGLDAGASVALLAR